MYASWTPLVHVPLFLAHRGDPGVWSENAMNLVLTGCAWVMADSFGRQER